MSSIVFSVPKTKMTNWPGQDFPFLAPRVSFLLSKTKKRPKVAWSFESVFTLIQNPSDISLQNASEGIEF